MFVIVLRDRTKKGIGMLKKYNELKNAPIMNYEQAKKRLKVVLITLISSRLIANVPVGALISKCVNQAKSCNDIVE